jgi:hypothetical protein
MDFLSLSKKYSPSEEAQHRFVCFVFLLLELDYLKNECIGPWKLGYFLWINQKYTTVHFTFIY